MVVTLSQSQNYLDYGDSALNIVHCSAVIVMPQFTVIPSQLFQTVLSFSSADNRFPQNAIWLKRIKVIWVVQSHIKKFSISRLTQISRISFAVPPLRGAFRDRHGREVGCGGRGWRCKTNGASADGEVVWS
jgi:hypothetical protein